MSRGGEKDRDDMGYLGEKIKLGGKMRYLRYTLPGLKLLAKYFGTVVDGLNAFKGFNPLFDEDGLDKLAKLAHAGLIHEDKTLTLEAVENMICTSTIIDLPAKLIRALNESLPESKGGGDGGNPT